MKTSAVIVLGLAGYSAGQKVGTQQSESHPSLTVSKCTSAGCTDEKKSVVLDSNWRWTHDSSGTNCYTGNEWSSSLCSGSECTEADAAAAAAKCVLEGGDYEGTYDITTEGAALTLGFVTVAYQANIGSRTYLLDSDGKTYTQFMLKNKEFTFDVDVSNLPCGLNGALYFVEMDADGGMGAHPTNEAGAGYGTGYCDAQCPHDLKYTDGAANLIDWVPSATDSNSGVGKYGSCCTEMDIWEANLMSNAYTLHTCTVEGQYTCTGTKCGDISADEGYDGVCDKDGCDYTPYRLGATDFYGAGASFAVDTDAPFTVITQFITDDGTNDGELVEIRRKFVQDGVVIDMPSALVGGTEYDSVTDEFCDAQKVYFNGTGNEHKAFTENGGLKAMGESMARGQTLVMSLWDDHSVNMLWLDSTYPTDADPATPGVARGPCDIASGDPIDVETNSPNSNVIYSNIKYGAIGSTFDSSGFVCKSDASLCNVCDSCCFDYIGDCDACVTAQCS